jgi:regulation of enolase protein 1 (concanavalin A-like superfamily)
MIEEERFLMDETIQLAQLPMPLQWATPAERWHVADGTTLTMTAGGTTDLFINPQGGAAVLNAPRLLGAVAGDFLLSARVAVAFEATFDAGALLLEAQRDVWAKLCFEYSPLGQPMVVSVVTRGLSDDANAFVVDGEYVWLRVARMGQACAFHASLDGQTWQLIRHFALEMAGMVEAGFVVQSPTGSGCTASFDHVRFVPERLRDIRDGS